MANPPFDLKICPIGGTGEMGANLTLFITPQTCIAVDFGMLFPQEDFYDLDYLIPDLDDLASKFPPPDFLFITHGHEDHIGAISHFVEKFPATKIVAPPFAAEIMRRKLGEKKIKASVKTYHESDVFEFSDMVLHPIQVNHSIPQTHGLCLLIEKKQLAIFHASDFKMELDSPYETATNIKKINHLMKGYKEKIFLLDSTNVTSTRDSHSEKDVKNNIKKIVKNASGHVFFTLFSSNIFRIQSIIDAAAELKKNLYFAGASLHYMTQAAERLNLLQIPAGTMIDLDKADSIRANSLILLSGCQGDFRSTLRRVADGDHPMIKFSPKDAIIFSSRTIPGNEKSVMRLYNQITLHGTQIITANDAGIHSSGHAAQKDLHNFIKQTKPTAIIPIHGEDFFIDRFAQFVENDFPKTKVFKMHNHDQLCINNQKFWIQKADIKEIPAPISILNSGCAIEKDRLKERRKMATQGVVFVTITKKKTMLSLIGLPDFLFNHQEKLENQITSLRTEILKTQKQVDRQHEEMKIKIRALIKVLSGIKPQVFLHWENND